MPFRVPTRARSRSHVKWLQRCLSRPSSSHGRCKVTVDEQRSPTLASRARPRGLTWPAASVMLQVRRPALFAVSHWSSGSTSRLLVDSVQTPPWARCIERIRRRVLAGRPAHRARARATPRASLRRKRGVQRSDGGQMQPSRCSNLRLVEGPGALIPEIRVLVVTG